MCSACGGKKRLLDPLELELQGVVSHLMGTGNQIRALRKSVCPASNREFFLISSEDISLSGPGP